MIVDVPLGELLPHGPEMTLLDRLVEYSAQRSVAALTVHADSKFCEQSGVPSWVGIEYMAQTVAAHAGFEARLDGRRPAVGFLLGTRSYRSEVGAFPLGATLSITVEPVAVDGKVAAFQCSIQTDRVLATAIVNTYQPDADELEAMRRGGGS